MTELNGSGPAELMIEPPQFQVTVQPGAAGKLIMTLFVTTSGTQAQYYLCTPEDDNFTHIAEQWRKMIMQAGTEARREASGLKIVQEIPHGLRSKKGRE